MSKEELIMMMDFLIPPKKLDFFPISFPSLLQNEIDIYLSNPLGKFVPKVVLASYIEKILQRSVMEYRKNLPLRTVIIIPSRPTFEDWTKISTDVDPKAYYPNDTFSLMITDIHVKMKSEKESLEWPMKYVYSMSASVALENEKSDKLKKMFESNDLYFSLEGELVKTTENDAITDIIITGIKVKKG